MRSPAMLRWAAAALAVLLAVAAPVGAFYLPGVAPNDFAKGDPLQVKVNKLTSIKTQLPYTYYSLPFCKPPTIVDSAENLGEVLRGDRIENSPYVFQMREPKMCQIVCKVTISEKEAKELKEKIEDEYRVNMILDNLPLVVPIPRQDKNTVAYQGGYHVGVKGRYAGNKDEKHFIHNHLSFLVKYHKDDDSELSRIVGFEVQPFSVKHQVDDKWNGVNTRLTTCDPHANKFITSSESPQEVEAGKDIIFTYDVRFEDSEIKWASRWAVLYVRSWVSARRRRRRRIRTQSAREPAPMAAAQEKVPACCGGADRGGGAPVPVRAIAASPAGKVAMAAGDERVAASAGGGAVIEEIAAVQPATAKASSKGVPIMTRAQRSHPLDPLSAAEIAVAVATVRAAGRSPEERDSMRFVEVVLLEPEKNVVALADAYFFPPFQPSLLPRTKGSAVIPSRLPPRRARLVVYNKQSNETSIWIVELSEVHAATRGGHHRGKVISSEVVPEVQPAMDAMEYAECEATVKSYPPFIEAMKRRGVDDMELVMVDAWCAGYYGDADAPSRRLGKPLIFCRTESDSPMENGYARPVEGIHVVVDMQNNAVIEFEDRKLVPLPPPDHLRNYTPGETRGGVDRSDVKPLIINQPEGPSFRVNGHFVEWQKWNFRIGFTPKEGLVIHSVAYVDGSRGRRPIAHRLSFVEMVVPYGDPNEPHYRKNAFDAGEDGLGKNAHSLKKGCDCLGYIKYFDAHFTNFTGGVETIENCVCLHEEDHGILWKHQDWRTGLAEVRRSRRLTVSFICTVANYEYGFYWHFYQDGKIEAEVKLTGILSLGALMPGESRKYGTTIAPALYAPVRQHFFVARMDMAIDCKPNEAYNQVVEVNVKMQSAGAHNVHNNAFYAEEKLLKSELQAMRDCDPSSARHWIVRNTRTVNRTGQPTGYKLVPGSNCLPLALPEAKFLRRAGFLKHNLWVTPYKSDEMFPGGEFPNQNPRIHEGLPTWVKKDRPLEETNIVLWYVFGLTHIPRLEDWPVMPAERIGFMLMPHGFFNCSPAVDVPPASSDADVKEAESPKAIQNGLISKL